MSMYNIIKDSIQILYLNTIVSPKNIMLSTYIENMTSSVQYAYSLDDITYSSYYDNFDTMTNNILENELPGIPVHIRMRITTMIVSPKLYSVFDIDSIKIIDASNVQKDMTITGVESEKNVRFTTQQFGNNFTQHSFNPYLAVEPAQAIREQLADAVYETCGIPVVYFKTAPIESAKSITFKTYPLHNVIDYKQFKINIQDNEIPINTPEFTEMLFGYQDELNIDIVKKRFHDLFQEPPNDHDYLYMPLTKRMYKINSPTEYRDFMNKSIMYKAVLVKWFDDATVDDTLVQDQIDSFTTMLQDQDYAKHESEIEIATGKGDSVNDNNTYSRILSIGQNLAIVPRSLMFEGMTRFNNMYRSSDQVAIKYDVTSEGSTDIVAISAWFSLSRIDVAQTLLRLSNSDDTKVIELGFRSDNVMCIKTIINGQTSTMIASDMFKPVANELYALYLTYNTIENEQCISLINQQGQTIQTNADVTLMSDADFMEFEICGGYDISMIRLYYSIPEVSCIAMLANLHPDCMIVDNCTTVFAGEQLRNVSPASRFQRNS